MKRAFQNTTQITENMNSFTTNKQLQNKFG